MKAKPRGRGGEDMDDRVLEARRTIVTLGILGLSLAGATVMQAVTARGPAATTAASPSRLAARQVAAEGRVVTYPGSEVVVGAERSGRLVRLSVEEGQVVRKGDLSRKSPTP